MEGHSHISPEVLARYAADAAAEVRGVHTKQRRGARVAGHEIEVQVVAADVQRRVSDYLERMTDVRPESVHVVVDDIQRP